MHLFFLIAVISGDFPGGPVVKTQSFTAADLGSIPGQGTKIPQTLWCRKKKKNSCHMCLFVFYLDYKMNVLKRKNSLPKT